MSGGEISGYYNLMSDGGNFEEEGHGAAEQLVSRGDSNTTVQHREEHTGNGDLRSDLTLSPNGSILKKSLEESLTPDHQKEEGDSIIASNRSRVTFNGS